jgi:hypothetical protein
MIAIRLDGNADFLDTLPDTSISIKLENPILGDGEKLSPGSYSMPFEIPAGRLSEKNSAQLNHPDVIENNEPYKPLTATLYVSSDAVNAPIPFKSGNLKTQSVSGDKAQVYFTFGLNSISESFKTARLRDMVDEVFTIPSTSSVVKSVRVKKLWSSGNHSITINGRTYTDDSISGLGVLINDYFTANMIPNSGLLLPWSSLNGGDIVITMATIATDFLGFDQIVHSTDIFAPLTINIDADDRMNWELIPFDMTTYYNGFRTFLNGYLSGAYPNDKIRFPFMLNAGLYGEPIKTTEFINGRDNNGILTNAAPTGSNLQAKNINSLQPFVMLKYLFDRIATMFSFEYEGDFYSSLADQPRLIDNSVTLDVPMEFIGDTKLIFWRNQFNLSELVPDVTVVDFLKGIQSRYNMSVYVNEVTKKVRLQTKESMAKSADYSDVTSISGPVKGIEDLGISGFTIRVNKEENDTFSAEESRVIGEGDVEIPVLCGRIQKTKTVLVNGGQVKAPYVSRKNADGFGLRVFHYAGIKNNGKFSYAAADINGTTINESLSDDPVNIYSKYWQYWLMFMRNRLSVKTSIQLPLRTLLQLDWEKKHRFDRTNYLIKSIDLRITNKQLTVSGCEIITMR